MDAENKSSRIEQLPTVLKAANTHLIFTTPELTKYSLALNWRLEFHRVSGHVFDGVRNNVHFFSGFAE